MRLMQLMAVAACGALGSVAAAQMGADAPDVPNNFVEKPGFYEFSGRMIVRPKSVESFRRELGLSALQAEQRLEGATGRLDPMLNWTVPITREYIIDVPVGSDENTIAAQLMSTGDYDYVEPDWICYPSVTTPNDPRYGQQWHHSRIRSAVAWDFTQGGGVRLGFVDTGWDVDHEDLVGRVVAEYNSANGGSDASDINGHGTHVGGCVGATGNNGRGVAGMGWDFELVCVRATNNPGGGAAMTSLTAGARWAIFNADARAVSVSYSGVQSSSVQSTGLAIWQAGGILLWAAGNSNTNHAGFDHQNVIIVGATTQSDTKWSSSSYGRAIDVVAPGVGILSTTRDGGYQAWNGTSMATPLVNGLIGLIWAVNPDLTNQEVQDIIFETCADLGSAGEDNIYGHGRIDAGAAVEMAAGDIVDPEPVALPFADLFPDIAPNAANWLVFEGDINDAALAIPSPLFAAELDGESGGETIESQPILAGGVPLLELNFSTQIRGAENGESLSVEYFDNIGQWQLVTTIVSNGSNETTFTDHQFFLAGAALHDELRLRFSSTANNANDNFFIDNVLLFEFVGGGEECPPDWDGNGIVNSADVGAFLSDYFDDLANGTLETDYDENGVVNAADVGSYLGDYFEFLGDCP